MPRFRMLRRSVLEIMPPTPAQVAEGQARDAERCQHAIFAPLARVLSGWWRDGDGWYAVERGAVVRVDQLNRSGRWLVVEFEDYRQTRIPLSAVQVLSSRDSSHALAWPVRLADTTLKQEILDPSFFFRNPEERGFWEAIVREPADATPRLIYADWLDEHDDPDAWIFRQEAPFNRSSAFNLGWLESASQILRQGFNWQQTSVWAMCSQTQEHRIPRYVPHRFADGSRLPQFVAYLLVMIRIRHYPHQRDNDMDHILPQEDNTRQENTPFPNAHWGNANVRSSIRLTGVNNEFEGREWTFDAQFEVGRTRGGLVLDTPTGHSVSRRHAVVFRTNIGWWVADRGSTNGTWLNGIRVGEQSVGPLRPGDILQFAQVAFRVDMQFAAPGV